MKEKIEIGERVRAYDFPQYGMHMPDNVIQTTRNCYAEGIVETVGVEQNLCPRYKIRVERRVFDGHEIEFKDEPYVFPPVNGMPDTFGGLTSNVEKI